MTDQWERNRLNFEGVWQGSSQWYVRQEDGDLDLQQPTTVVENTRYAISFEDADTGLWDGTGLFLAPGGAAQYPLSRSTYNSSGACWQFEAAGGQSSLEVPTDLPRFGHEINFFHGRSRSMLVLLWENNNFVWKLQSIGTAAFRCSLSDEVEPERNTLSSVNQLLEITNGWGGSSEHLYPQSGLLNFPSKPVLVQQESSVFVESGVKGAFIDRLVCNAPEVLPSKNFFLEVGCLVSEVKFQYVRISFDRHHRLSRWERNIYEKS